MTPLTWLGCATRDQVLDREPRRDRLSLTTLPPAMPSALVRAVLADHRRRMLNQRQRLERIRADRLCRFEFLTAIERQRGQNSGLQGVHGVTS
jgi:hypothetical protein